MNPILRAVLLVMLMRAAEHLVDYINVRLRGAGGFTYELWILAPSGRGAPTADEAQCEKARLNPYGRRTLQISAPTADEAQCEKGRCDDKHAGPACDDPECWLRGPGSWPPSRFVIVPEHYPSHVTLASEVSVDETIAVCGVMFEVDTIIRAEGRCDRLVLAPVSIDMVPLGCAPPPGRIAGVVTWLRGFVRGLIEAIGIGGHR